MFTSIHHIHYVVRNRDEMVEYISNNFGMEPDDLHVVEGRGMKDALYRVGETLIEITEPALDADSGIGQHRAASCRPRAGRLSRCLRGRQRSSGGG